MKTSISLKRFGFAAVMVCALVGPLPLAAQTPHDTILDAREALRKNNRQRLAAARAAVMAAPQEQRHPLAMWVEYWDLSNRIADAGSDEIEVFYARWADTYVEDRLRNDWLLELGRRRDWATFSRDFPRFRMNDDREVTCYALLTEHLAGRDVRDAARAAWLAQRDADEGCALLAQTLYEAKRFDNADVWRKARSSIEAGRPRAAQKAVVLISAGAAAAVGEMNDNAARYVTNRASTAGRVNAELTALAIARLANNDAEAAAAKLESRFERALPSDLAGWTWAQVAKQAAQRLLPEANAWYQRAETLAGASRAEWSNDTRAWAARAALRADNGAGDWARVLSTIDAMTADEQRDPTWQYWRGRALKASAADGIDGAPQRAQGHAMLMALSGQLHFYGKLATEDLGEPVTLPSAPEPLTATERVRAVRNAGLERALQLIAIGLRDEGVREWNFSLRGMDDRELLAAAELACLREVWDRCINTSDRTRGEVDITQRFPLPFRSELVARASEAGLDPAYVFGLIRQESRFVMDARSSVGASGLMQLMPSTARWTAKKIGLAYSPDRIVDRDTNLKLGTTYLKLVLEDFDGSQAMAAAAYNAGPSRPRRWREGPRLDPAAWAENIPFTETRDYVKKVLSNATIYAALLGQAAPSLKARLGQLIGPRDTNAPALNRELP